ncbi:hypothetical protein GCM10023335_20600 [Streptomyces siamensis]|uniref:CsbD-like domain-containing protein n=1 Tax=Streptomyces siamensis TaxID=1274986 RepID=A0ABP9INT7_9ACTN
MCGSVSSFPRRNEAREVAVQVSKGSAKAKQVKGKMKQTVGKAVGNRSLKREGQAEMLGGKAQEMAEKAAHRARRMMGR